MFEVPPEPRKEERRLTLVVTHMGATQATIHEFTRAERVFVDNNPEGGPGWAMIYTCTKTGVERRFGFIGTRGAV